MDEVRLFASLPVEPVFLDNLCTAGFDEVDGETVIRVVAHLNVYSPGTSSVLFYVRPESLAGGFTDLRTLEVIL